MSHYIRKGKKTDFHKKQMKRLINILDDIIDNEGDARLEAIGRRQIIRYWKRTVNETNKTRLEKFHILNKFFNEYNPQVTVPKPF
jgi:hypothetical protein